MSRRINVYIYINFITQYQVIILVIDAISLHVCSSLPAIKVPVVLSKIDQLVAVTQGAATLGVALMVLEAVEGLERDGFRCDDIFFRAGGRAVLNVRFVLI